MNIFPPKSSTNHPQAEGICQTIVITNGRRGPHSGQDAILLRRVRRMIWCKNNIAPYRLLVCYIWHIVVESADMATSSQSRFLSSPWSRSFSILRQIFVFQTIFIFISKPSVIKCIRTIQPHTRHLRGKAKYNDHGALACTWKDVPSPFLH